jgi:hemerythrin
MFKYPAPWLSLDMVLIEWTPALSVNIQSIDAQHKKLFEYLNNLYDALSEAREKEILERLFHDLEEYTHYHFSNEEKHFSEYGYAEKDAHILQHHEFIRRLVQMKQQIGAGTMDAEDLLTFLVDWLRFHIKGNDHQYVDCFHQHGFY